jgi:ketosteroid isomerase-like protein
MTDSVKEQVGDLVSQAKRRVGVEAPSAADDDGRVGIVRGALRTFAEGDMDGFLDALREDVLWEAPNGGHFPGGGEQDGRDAVRKEYIDNAERTFTEFGFRPATFVDADDADAVIVIGRFEGDGVQGDRLDEPGVQIWEFQGNAVAKVRIFTDSAGFPEVITERKEKELEEKDRKEEEKRKEEDSDGDDGSGDEASSDGSEAKAEKRDDDGEDDDGSESDDGEKKDREGGDA